MQAMTLCKEKSSLYGVMADIAFAAGDVLAALGWAIKSFVADTSCNRMSSNQVLLYIGESALALGVDGFFDVLRSLTTTFDDQTRQKLGHSWRASHAPDRERASTWLARFGSDFMTQPGTSKLAPLAGVSNPIQCPRCRADIVILEHERHRWDMYCKRCGHEFQNPAAK